MESTKFIKLGWIGIGITSLIALLLYFISHITFAFIVPFYMPWMVFLLIGFTNKKK